MLPSTSGDGAAYARELGSTRRTAVYVARRDAIFAGKVADAHCTTAAAADPSIDADATGDADVGSDADAGGAGSDSGISNAGGGGADADAVRLPSGADTRTHALQFRRRREHANGEGGDSRATDAG